MATLIDTRAENPSTDGKRHGSEPHAPDPSRAQWRSVAIFTVVTYAVSWTLWFALVPHLWARFGAARTPNEVKGPSIIFLGMFVPMIVAGVMRLFVTHEGLRGSFGPVRGRARFFLIALFAPAALIAVVIAIADITGLADFHPGHVSWLVLIPGLVFNSVTLNPVLALGEEYGWRGYLLPKLLPLGEAKAAVVVGLIWGAWHVPLIVAGLNFADVQPLVAAAVFMVSAVLMSLLFTRLWVASGASLLVMAVLHGSLNAFGDRLADAKHLVGNSLVVTPTGAIGIGVMAVVTVILYTWARHPRGTSTTTSRDAMSVEHR